MTTDAKKKAKMNAEGTDVGACLAVHPEDPKVSVPIVFDKLALVDGPHAQPPLDGRDKRRALEECTSQGFDGLVKWGPR